MWASRANVAHTRANTLDDDECTLRRSRGNNNKNLQVTTHVTAGTLQSNAPLARTIQCRPCSVRREAALNISCKMCNANAHQFHRMARTRRKCGTVIGLSGLHGSNVLPEILISPETLHKQERRTTNCKNRCTFPRGTRRCRR